VAKAVCALPPRDGLVKQRMITFKSQALVAMAQASVAGVNDLHYLHDAVRGFVFFGTPHGGSSVLGKSRVNIMRKMCLAAFLEIPPKLEDALRAGSDEALDLADGFRNTKPFVDQKLLIATYYEQLGTPGLSGRVGFHDSNLHIYLSPISQSSPRVLPNLVSYPNKDHAS
jgi:hypothetical protein